MKQLLRFLPLAVLMFFAACQKEKITKDQLVTLNVTLTADQTYQLDLNQYGKPGSGISISKQATNAATSMISAMTYTYTPALKFTGTDKVEISVEGDEEPRCGNGYGNSNNKRKKLIGINFTIQ
jgi:Bacterial Ig domain